MYGLDSIMRKWLILGIVVIGLIGSIAYITYQNIDRNLNNLLKQEIEDISLSRVDDGKFVGEFEAFPITVKLEVEIENHKIKNIVILKHENGQGRPAESIIQSVIESNSIDVDVISGASYSSKVILNAISNAINQK